MSVHCWGTGKNGELGLGDTNQRLDPQLMEYFHGKKIRQISCGEQHSLALAELGDVFVWGRGREGQLGNGSSKEGQKIPKRVWTLRDERIVKAVCGYYHNLAITSDGAVYEWGKLHRLPTEGEQQEFFGSAIGLQGLQTSLQSMLYESHKMYCSAKEPTPLDLGDEEVPESSSPDSASPPSTPVVSEESRSLYNFAEFIPYIQSIPKQVENLTKVTEVAAGYSFSVAITLEGRVYSWGFNDKFQLGLGHRFNQSTPQLIKSLESVRIIQASAGQQHSALLSEEGNVYTFGLGVFGQLGHGSSKDERNPKMIKSSKHFTEDKMIQVACGSFHTLALNNKGQVYTWGSAEYSQQGGLQNYSDWQKGNKGETEEGELSGRVPRILEAECFENRQIGSISCGHLYNIGITKDDMKDVYTWGWGSYGVLGHGNHRYTLIPQKIRKLEGERIIQVDGGSKHTIAISLGSATSFAFDFKRAFTNKKWGDLIFTTDLDKGFIISHKLVVYNRSRYLKTLALMSERFSFSESHDDENNFGLDEKPIVLHFKGIRIQVLTAVLFYLYTDHISIAPHMISLLSKAAVLFKLKRLEGLCSDVLKENEKRLKAEIGDESDDEDDSFELKKDNSDSTQISTFSDDLRKCVNNEEWADVLFEVKEDQIDDNLDLPDLEKKTITSFVYGHKVILAARSDYFRRIFEGGFRESGGGQLRYLGDSKSRIQSIEINNISKDIFIKMLEFIYTGDECIVKEGDIVIDLLMASDRFLIEDLKQLCELEIENGLDVDNVVYVYEIADRANAPRLKKGCFDLIRVTWTDVISKNSNCIESLKHVASNSVHLLEELDRKLVAVKGQYSEGEVFEVLKMDVGGSGKGKEKIVESD